MRVHGGIENVLGAVAVLVSILLFDGSFAFSARQATGSDLANVLKLFPGYHLQTLKELDSDARSFFAQQHPKANPSLVRGDFDGDGNADYALLLRKNDSDVGKLVIVLCRKPGSCEGVYQLEQPAISGLMYLRPVPAGSRVTPVEGETKDSVKLRTAGIEVSYFEKSSAVLYWDAKQKKMEEIWTSD